jgi:hypothetical protein
VAAPEINGEEDTASLEGERMRLAQRAETGLGTRGRGAEWMVEEKKNEKRISLCGEEEDEDGETIRNARWRSDGETWMRTIDSALTARDIARVVRKFRNR